MREQEKRATVAAVAAARMETATLAPPPAQIQDPFLQRPFLERKTALNLAQLAHAGDEFQLGSDEIDSLLKGLIVRSHVIFG